jgi:uncharacterized protein YdhG (YjbR/CyaY superfamily)
VAGRPAPGAGTSGTAQVDAYLATLPADQRAALQALRETIAAVTPNAEEAISYGVPAFRYRGRGLVWYAGAKNHCSFFTGGQAIDDHRSELAGFSLSRGTIRFTPDHPLPVDLVERIVRERMANTDAAAAAKPSRRA